MYKSTSQNQVFETNQGLFEITNNSSKLEKHLEDLIIISNYFEHTKYKVYLQDLCLLIQKKFKIDFSSVNPNFEPESQSTILDLFSKENILDLNVELDDFLRMPPINTYEVKVKITKIEKAKPRIDFTGYTIQDTEEVD